MDPSVRPQIAGVAVGKGAGDAGGAHQHRPQAGDEVDEIDVVAADVGERIGVVAGKPVPEVRVAVEARLDHPRLAVGERPEVAAAVLAAGDQRPPVEALVVVDADEQTPLGGKPAEPAAVLAPLHQRFDAVDVLIALQRVGYDAEVQVVGHRHEHHLMRRQRIQRAPVGVRVADACGRVGPSGKAVAGKRFGQLRIGGERPDPRGAGGRHRDGADLSAPLQVVERRQDHVAREHAGAHHDGVDRAGLRSAAGRGTIQVTAIIGPAWAVCPTRRPVHGAGDPG